MPLPSLATPLEHHAVLPPLTNQLDQHFPLSHSQQYSPQRAFTPLQSQLLPPFVSTTVDLTLSGPLRRGKWTRAEEDYAAATISYFCDGLLAIQYGTTLRGYLAQQLHCDPMRISKKLLPGSVFAGIKINPKIGRRAYYPCTQDSPAATRSKENATRHLASLRQAFIQSIEEEDQTQETTSTSAIKDSPTRSAKTHTPTRSSPKLVTSIGRKRSFDDINNVVRAQQLQQQGHLASVELTEPQIFYHFQHQSQSTPFSSRHANVSVSKLPKLKVTDDVSRYTLYSTQQRSVSPVTVATSTSVLPPLRVSLVRASMC